MNIRAFRDPDWAEWLRMSLALFPEYAADDLASGMRDARRRDDYEEVDRIVQFRQVLAPPPTGASDAS